jgi:trans-aconitate 2-methyltransferase
MRRCNGSPRLFSLLAPGGVLAVQMPDNHNEATHRAMRDIAALPGYAERIGDPGRLRPGMLKIQDYYDLLAREAEEVDVWHTVYQHRMDAPAAIVEWLRSTGLKPFLEALDAQQRTAFLAEYERRMDAAYPARSDGRRLLAFPRLFIVARRRA